MTTAINLYRLHNRKEQIRESFMKKQPFRYTVIDNFLCEDAAESIFKEFPSVDPASWVDASGLHSKRKWTQPTIEESFAANFYQEINSDSFREWLSDVVGIPDLLSDPDLQGAGLHQTLEGGYLDVHVDFNKHNRLQLDRRLNLIVYLCREHNTKGEGYLELWDMEKKQLLDSIPPAFNTCVIFETNEVSFHGHPKPWKNNYDETRKSLSVYYYTEGRNDIPEVSEHSTIYVNTEGQTGALKTIKNAARDIMRLGPIRRRLADRKKKNNG